MPMSSKDLWASALEALPENDREQLAFYNDQDRLNILSDLQVLTENAKEQCIKKRWRFRRPGRNGETIVLRDLFNKMVVWINVFKEIGDTVVQYDPGHAALPWAGVRFILQIAVGDIVKFDFVVSGAESIARMIGRFAIFEEIYLRHTSKTSMELENALVRLYSTVLVYLSKAKTFFDQSSPKRLLKSVLVTEDEFESLAKKMDLQQSNVDRCASIFDAENQKGISDSLNALSIGQYEKHARLMDLLHSIDGPILRMSSQLNKIEDYLDKSKRHEILRWVSTQPYLEHHEQISKKALSGTGRWLLKDPTYAKWHKESSSSLLWLHGKVGAGKSTLVSIVIEDVMRRFEAGQNPPPVYFYCSRTAAEPQRSDPAAILSSIVRQLSCAEPGLPLLPPVVEMYEKKGQGFDSRGLHIEESCELITRLIEHYPMTTIVIDALDECNPETREKLLDAIETLLQDSSLGLLKVFLSSRDDQDIACTLREYPNLDVLSSRNSADIEAFVKDETDRLVKKRRLLRNSHAKEELKVLIVDEVSKSADGMFRWASLQLELLCTMKLDEDVRARLGRIPPKLEQLYLEIYENNLLKHPGEVGRSIISKIMKWLLCAQRPLKFLEFCDAVVLNNALPENLTKEHVLDLCHNFVVFDDSLEVFRFAHLSVREFLEKQNEYMANSCHLLAAETCLLQFIGISDSPTAKAFLQHHYTPDVRGKATSSAELLGGFHNYATMFWARHCQLIGEEGRKTVPHFERIFRFFLSDASNDLSPLNVWIQYHRRGLDAGKLSPGPGCKPEDGVYYVACTYGFCEIIRVCMNENPRRLYKEGLNQAVDCREEEALKVLLSNHNGDEISVDLVSRVALKMDWVLHKSRIEITAVLSYLTRGWVVVVPRGELVGRLVSRYKPLEVSKSLLAYAARCCSASTFESLLANSDCARISWDLLVDKAGQTGNLEVLKLLMETQKFKPTPKVMQTFAKSGDEKIMRLLLDREDLGSITDDIISASCSNRNEKVPILLLDRCGFDGISREAVTGAIKNPNERVLSLLLNNGYPMSQTLVNEAATYGFASTLRLLLDRGGFITSVVLRCAAGNRSNGIKIMSLLLAEAKDWIVAAELTEMTKIALQNCSWDVVRLLLEWAGHTLIAEDVLVAAVNILESGDLIRLLFERDWEITNEVLEAMMRNLHSEETLQLVLDRMVDLEITEGILLAAASNWSFGDKLVGLLLDRVNLVDIIDPLLTEAAGNTGTGLEVIMLLQRRVGKINVTQKALERASGARSVRTVIFLLDRFPATITESMVVGALIKYDIKMVELILKRATDLPITRKLVYMTARYSDPECLSFILQRACTADMNEDVIRELAQAAIENTICHEILEFLLDKVGNNVIGHLEVPMSVASECVLNFLINHGVAFKVTQKLLLAATANIGNDSSLMKFLLEQSNGVALTDEFFRAAAGAGSKAVLQVLSQYCGLPKVPKKWLDLVRLRDAVTRDHHCRDQMAIDFNLDEVIDLLGREVEPDVPDGSGRTPLFHATKRGDIATVQALLSAGADPNSMDRRGRTPLFRAAKRGHFDIVEILLDLGVPSDLEDEMGYTPASIAKRSGHLRIFRLLERRRRPTSQRETPVLDLRGRPLAFQSSRTHSS